MAPGRIYAPSTDLTWSEKLKIRECALQAAAIYCGERKLDTASVAIVAKEFEKYLKGE